jgi:hypothetical protein
MWNGDIAANRIERQGRTSSCRRGGLGGEGCQHRGRYSESSNRSVAARHRAARPLSPRVVSVFDREWNQSRAGRAMCSRALVGRVVLLGLRAPRRLSRRLGLLRLGWRLGRRFRLDVGGLGRRLCLDRHGGLDRRGRLDRLGLLGRLRPARRATASNRRGSRRDDSFGSSLQALLLLPLTVPAPAPNRPRASTHVKSLNQPAVARGV